MKHVRVLAGAAFALLVASDPAPARPGQAPASEYAEAGQGEAAARVDALIASALEAYRAGDAARSEALAGEALSLARKGLGERDPATLRSLATRALALGALGRAREAEPLASEALRLQRETLGERHPDTLESQAIQGTILLALGRLQEAEAAHARALRLRREILGESHPDTLASLNDYAGLLNALGRAAEAEPLLADALARARAVLGESHPETLRSLQTYTLALRRQGRAAEAEPLVMEVLRLRRETLGERHPDTLDSLSGYAATLAALGRKADALAVREDVLRARREVLGERHPQTLISLNNYATELRSLGRVAEAEPLFAQALQLRTETLGERHPQTLNSLNNYAIVLRRLGRTEEAEPLYAEALALRRASLGERHPDTLQSLNNHANVLRALGRADEAETLFAEALRLYREVLGERHPMTLRSLNNYAVHLLDAVDERRALAPYRELIEATRARAAQLSEAGLSGDAQRDRELADRQAKEQLFADILWANTQGDAARIEALRTEAFTALQFASAGSTSKAVAEAAALRFASSEGLEALVQERQVLGREWVEIEAELVKSQAGGEENARKRSQLRVQLEAADRRITAIDEQLRREVPQYFAILSQQPASLEATRAILGSDEAVLFLVPTVFGTHAMALTKEGLEWAQTGRFAAGLEEDVAALREGLEVKDEYLPLFDLALAHRLYSDLVAPVESVLKGKARVYVVAGGALSRLPLGTLITEEVTGEPVTDDPAVLRAAPWLADRYALVQIPSLQSLVYIRSFGIAEPEQGMPTFRGFGNPLLDGQSVLRGARSATYLPGDAVSLRAAGEPGASGTTLMDPEALRKLARLPGTARELQQVRAALDAPEDALYLGENMTETAIRAADLSRTAILHLATHGLTSEESGSLVEPGLVFTPPQSARLEDDGYLAASEIVGIDLTAARWVILSACNTASPSGKPGETGLSGLAQAFFYAGAESLLVTHWPVFDDIAPVLTVKALQLSQSGIPRAEALQAAMREIRQDPAYNAAHPAVWAPFALVGEGR